MLEHRGKRWEPQVFAICMAWDAFRLSLGGKPKNFTLHEVVTWVTVRNTLGEGMTSAVTSAERNADEKSGSNQ